LKTYFYNYILIIWISLNIINSKKYIKYLKYKCKKEKKQIIAKIKMEKDKNLKMSIVLEILKKNSKII
jgi:hypothetical protein